MSGYHVIPFRVKAQSVLLVGHKYFFLNLQLRTWLKRGRARERVTSM